MPKVISPKNFSIGKPTISEMLNQSKKEDPSAAIDIQQLRSKDFSNEEVQKSWNDFASSVENQGKKSLLHTLTISKPEIKDKHIVHFKVMNAVQESDMQSVLTPLSLKLRNDLHNDHIRIEIETIKDNSERKPYTNKEKFLYLRELYPNLEKLRVQLDLEI